MGLWTITIPEATTNYVLNPSAETAGNYAGHNSATVAIVSAAAQRGIYCYDVLANGGTNRGIALTLGTLTNAIHYVSFYIYDTTLTGTLQVSLDGTNYNSAAIITPESVTGWIRYGVQVPAVQANGSTSLIIRDTVAEVFFLDAVQVEAKSYYTDYIDGSLTGGLWAGLYHGSTSSRDAQNRLNGREVDLETTYSVKVLSMSGIGMPPIVNNLQPMSLQPGAIFQSYKIMPRTIDLLVSTQVNITSAYSMLHTRRNSLLDLLAPDQVRGNQPVKIGYTGANANRTVYCEYRYDGGLEFNSPSGRNEKIPIRLIAVDPLMYEDTQQQQVLTIQSSLASNNYAAARVNGTWQNLGTGFDGVIYAVKADEKRGRVYYGGAFANANGVACAGICYWNGTTFVAMGAGVTGGGGFVRTIEIANNGDVWVGGDFTSAGGSTSDGLAMWDISAGAWVQFAQGTAGDVIFDIAIDKNGLVYVGGLTGTWNGVANTADLFSYDPATTTFAALSTGVNATVRALAIGADGTTLYLGGSFTTPQTRLAKWNGTAFSALGAGASGNVHALIVDTDGSLYAAGEFTTTPSTTRIAKWNGSNWSDLGSGLDNTVNRLAISESGALIAAGSFTSAGGSSLADRVALWNGSNWYALDIDLPGTPSVYADLLNDDIYLGYSTTGTATAAFVFSLTPASSAQTYPIITINGPTTADTYCTLQRIENQTTNQVLYFDLDVREGETVVIDLRPGYKTVTSNNQYRIYGQPLGGSDRDTFHLLPSANQLSVLITGTTTGVVAAMTWRPTHWGADGVA